MPSMISWIVASHQPETLAANLLATLDLDGDQLIVENRASIAEAYAEGQARATHPIRVYVHHDVQILDQPQLRDELIRWCPLVGIVGVIGSWNRHVPYWESAVCGSVMDARMGRLGPGKGGDSAYLDGLLLATAREITWDTAYPGWHWYDHDACEQMLSQGLPNWCLTNGHELVFHNTTSAFEPDEDWTTGRERFREKWGR